MKKLLAAIIAGIWLLSFSAHETETPIDTNCPAFEMPYAKITYAYEIVRDCHSDIYKAQQASIAYKSSLINYGYKFLDMQLLLDESEIEFGIVARMRDLGVPNEEIPPFIERDGVQYFAVFQDNMTLACISLVKASYDTNGKMDEAMMALEEAKEMIDALGPYNEYYLPLKIYYDNTQDLFDFCQENPLP